eukprot:g2140.t1
MTDEDDRTTVVVPKNEDEEITAAEKVEKMGFELGKSLGKGGQANVRLAKEIRSGQLYACKFYDLRYLAMRTKVEYLRHMRRLNLEIKIMQQCDHPNIVKFTAAVSGKDSMCLMMEYLKGIELFDVIANGGAMKEDEAEPIARQMLSAVAYLHKKNIMHRDIKPENVMLVSARKGEGKVVKLIDFGYGKVISHSQAYTQVGTREYQAPEVNPMNRTHGDADPYTSAADIFSLGAVMYAMLAGTFPQFTRSGEPDLRLIRASEDAKELVGMLMRRDPKRRPSAERALKHRWFSSEDDATTKKNKEGTAIVVAPPIISVVATDDTVGAGETSSKMTALVSPSDDRRSPGAVAKVDKNFADMTSIDRNLSQMVELQISIASTLKEAFEIAVRDENRVSMLSPVRIAAVKCREQLVATSSLLQLIAQSAEMVCNMVPDLRLAVEETEPGLAHDFFNSVKKSVALIKSRASEMVQMNAELAKDVNALVGGGSSSSSGAIYGSLTPGVAASPQLTPTIESFQKMVSEAAKKNTVITPNVLLQMVCCLFQQHGVNGARCVGDVERSVVMEVDNEEDECKSSDESNGDPRTNEHSTKHDHMATTTKDNVAASSTNAIVPFEEKRQLISSAPTCDVDSVRRKDSEQLRIVWERLCHADSLLQHFSSFWMNMEVMVDLLMQRNEYIDNFVRYTKNERIQQRFFQHLDAYTRWWSSIRSLCREYYVKTRRLLDGGADNGYTASGVYDFLLSRSDAPGSSDRSSDSKADEAAGLRDPGTPIAMSRITSVD